MAPPDYPGIPGLQIRRPRPVNPPPPESIPPPAQQVEVDHVVMSRGRWRLAMSPMAALVLLACVACGAVGYLFSYARKPPEDPSGIVADVRNQMAAQKQSEQEFQQALIHRFEGLETQVSRLQDSQDRLRERVNDRLAHP